VTLASQNIYYDPSSKSLNQSTFYSEPKNETVLIVLSDNSGHKVDYQMELSFRCDDAPPLLAVGKAIKTKVITASITNITADGNVTITFSSRLLVP
jgi:hypothetical protein